MATRGTLLKQVLWAFDRNLFFSSVWSSFFLSNICLPHHFFRHLLTQRYCIIPSYNVQKENRTGNIKQNNKRYGYLGAVGWWERTHTQGETIYEATSHPSDPVFRQSTKITIPFSPNYVWANNMWAKPYNILLVCIIQYTQEKKKVIGSTPYRWLHVRDLFTRYAFPLHTCMLGFCQVRLVLHQPRA